MVASVDKARPSGALFREAALQTGAAPRRTVDQMDSARGWEPRHGDHIGCGASLRAGASSTVLGAAASQRLPSEPAAEGRLVRFQDEACTGQQQHVATAHTAERDSPSACACDSAAIPVPKDQLGKHLLFSGKALAGPLAAAVA